MGKELKKIKLENGKEEKEEKLRGWKSENGTKGLQWKSLGEKKRGGEIREEMMLLADKTNEWIKQRKDIKRNFLKKRIWV